MSELARRYAEALYDLSPDEESLRATAQAMMADAALWESLRSPAVQAWEKEHIQRVIDAFVEIHNENLK